MTVTRRPAVLVLALLVVLPVGSATLDAGQPERVNPTAAAVNAFRQRIDAYLELRKQAEAQVPRLKETNDPHQIAASERELGEEIRRLRQDAKPGDVFLAEFRPVLLDLVRKDFASRSAGDRKALINEVPVTFVPTVNMTYPPTLPLVTVPGKLLRALPPLPESIEYRIVGRHLVLRDVKANLVVDFVRDAVPTIPS